MYNKISSLKAPLAVGPYSQAIRIGDFLYTSGQIALDPDSGIFLSGEIEEETEQTLKNISAILQAGGVNFENVIKTTVYLSDLNHFSRMNQVYEKYFSFFSIKKNFLCISKATLPKVPLPANGSKIKSPTNE